MIGVFDSGWGGLSVVRDIRSLLPAVALRYVADHAFCPYGDRPEAVIRERSRFLASRLLDDGADAIVVACNTASSLALDRVREVCSPVPVVGVVPAVKPAAAASRSGAIAVLATQRTAEGAYLARLAAEHAAGVRMVVVPAPELVAAVERGETAGARLEAEIAALLRPALLAGVDQIVLGCTHFPFLRPTIERVVGPEVAVVDSGPAVARRLRAVLPEGEPGRIDRVGDLRLGTTGDPTRVGAVAGRLMGRAVSVAAYGLEIRLVPAPG